MTPVAAVLSTIFILLIGVGSFLALYYFLAPCRFLNFFGSKQSCQKNDKCQFVDCKCQDKKESDDNEENDNKEDKENTNSATQESK